MRSLTGEARSGSGRVAVLGLLALLHPLDRTLALDPESVTVYQMEVPHNTIIYRGMKDREDEVAPVADWETKRRWVRDAFERFEGAGYQIGSAYTAYKGEQTSFLYRDALWHGADMLGWADRHKITVKTGSGCQYTAVTTTYRAGIADIISASYHKGSS